jgi:hypothetical protein
MNVMEPGTRMRIDSRASLAERGGVDLVDLVRLVSFVQPKNQTNQIN